MPARVCVSRTIWLPSRFVGDRPLAGWRRKVGGSRDLRRGLFHRGWFQIIGLGLNNMANSTVATQTQLAMTCFETPPFETTPLRKSEGSPPRPPAQSPSLSRCRLCRFRAWLEDATSRAGAVIRRPDLDVQNSSEGKLDKSKEPDI